MNTKCENFTLTHLILSVAGWVEREPEHLHDRAEESAMHGHDYAGCGPQAHIRRPQHEPHAERHRHVRPGAVALLSGASCDCSHHGRW